jgi:ABC-type uncharacterized transport system substrate-binding protein
VTVFFNKNGIEGIQITWLFDEMFSNMIIFDFDSNHDQRLNEKEIENIRKDAFSNLSNFHYFSYISINGKDFPFSSVTDFIAFIHEDRIIYQFFIPCSIPVEQKEQLITVAAYDSSYYCDIAFTENNPLLLKNNSGFNIRYDIVKNEKNPIYSGQVFPYEIQVWVSR